MSNDIIDLEDLYDGVEDEEEFGSEVPLQSLLASGGYMYTVDDDEEEFLYENIVNEITAVDTSLYGSTHDHLMLESSGESNIIEDDEEEFGTSTALVVQDVQTTALSVYSPSEEAEFVSNRFEIMNRMLEAATGELRSESQIFTMAYSYLSGPDCKSIPGGKIEFQSRKYSQRGNFHSLLVGAVHNQYNVSGIDGLDDSELYNLVLDVIECEGLYYRPSQLQQMAKEIEGFVSYFQTLLKTYVQRPMELADAIQYAEVLAPKLVLPYGYICPRCNSYVETQLPPLTLLITKRQGKYTYHVTNVPVACECQTLLALPEILIDLVHTDLVAMVKDQEVSFQGYAFYRPAVKTLMPVIPSNFQYLFNLEDPCMDAMNIYSTTASTMSDYVFQYISIVDFMMRSEEVQSRQVELNFDLTPTSRNFYTWFNDVELNIDIATEWSQFVQTVVHHLDTLGCFALTPQNKAFYAFCDRNERGRKCFSDDFAIQWLSTNAWSLAGLRSVSASATDVVIEILPQYIEYLRYAFCLRMLAKVSNLNISSYKSWVSNPCSKDSLEWVSKLAASDMGKKLNKLSTSLRDRRTVEFYFSVEAYQNPHDLLSELVSLLGGDTELMRVLSPMSQEILDEVLFTDREEYLDINPNEKLLISKSLRFSEYCTVFMDCGAMLFASAISDMEIYEKAKMLVCASSCGRLGLPFEKSPTEPNNLQKLGEAFTPRRTEIEYYRDAILLADDNLPSSWIDRRAEMSASDFLMMAASSWAELLEDGVLAEKYPGVF